MRQLAIFGGTFDPVHWGHLVIAESALNQVTLEQIVWVPSFLPHHKIAASFEQRVTMIELAIQDNPAFTVSLVENKSGDSYAINTLSELSDFYPNTYWYWIVGLDTFESLPKWHQGKQLAQLCHWLIVPRLPSPQNITHTESICKEVVQQLSDDSDSIHWQLINTPIVGISSSMVRSSWRDRQSIRYLVPETVRSYISDRNLYTPKSG